MSKKVLIPQSRMTRTVMHSLVIKKCVNPEKHSVLEIASSGIILILFISNDFNIVTKLANHVQNY